MSDRPAPARLEEIRTHPRSMKDPWGAIRQLLAEIDYLTAALAAMTEDRDITVDQMKDEQHSVDRLTDRIQLLEIQAARMSPREPSEEAVDAAIAERRYDGPPPEFPKPPTEQMTRSLVRNKLRAAYAIDCAAQRAGIPEALMKLVAACEPVAWTKRPGEPSDLTPYWSFVPTDNVIAARAALGASHD